MPAKTRTVLGFSLLTKTRDVDLPGCGERARMFGADNAAVPASFFSFFSLKQVRNGTNAPRGWACPPERRTLQGRKPTPSLLSPASPDVASLRRPPFSGHVSPLSGAPTANRDRRLLPPGPLQLGQPPGVASPCGDKRATLSGSRHGTCASEPARATENGALPGPPAPSASVGNPNESPRGSFAGRFAYCLAHPFREYVAF
ncbi:PREDICTED: uncharacterized protein LOC106895255 [Calidris pugnax]|uniref:uncharacterized protein LOC106895255 n=1 Tax=Calidris pugnax TaxID=198806 RepID=UPI00071D3E01|nr:PREDICTED: uncharacterized protein LOC106895255 [Calidris pugnax]